MERHILTSGLLRHRNVLAAIRDKAANVGWFEENRYTTGEQVAEVMAINEYGTERIPARPLMRQSAATVNPQIQGFINRRIDDALAGRIEPVQVLKQVGEVVVATISEQFASGGFEPNAPSTVAKKGFDKPLIETGLASQSPQYKIESVGQS